MEPRCHLRLFKIGDRFYGVVTAFVPGLKAAGYFTSRLAGADPLKWNLAPPADRQTPGGGRQDAKG